MFDKNPKYNPKRRHFALKKKDKTTFCLVTIHYLFIFYTEKLIRLSTLHVYLMYLTLTKFGKTYLTSLYAPIWSLLAH
jgi:hypothetical protein